MKRSWLVLPVRLNLHLANLGLMSLLVGLIICGEALRLQKAS